MSGVQVLGVVHADECFVVVDSETIDDEIRSRRLVCGLDPLSSRTYTGGLPERPRLSDSEPTASRRDDEADPALRLVTGSS